MTIPLDAPLRGHRLAVVDVEGNGKNPPEIVEIAVLPVHDIQPNRGDMQTWLIRPKAAISPIVTRKVHGIRNSDVADCPPWPAVAGDVEALLADRVIVAHNATVEHRVLAAHLPSWRPPLVLDTLRLAKHTWPHLERYGLDELLQHIELDLDTSESSEQRRHRASFDTWCAWGLLLVLADQSGLDWDGIVKVATLPNFAPPHEDGGGLW
jgi:DNA polymerase III epsilon subunit-like protein